MTRREEIEAELAEQEQKLRVETERVGDDYIRTLTMRRMIIRALNLELTNLGIDEAAEATRGGVT